MDDTIRVELPLRSPSKVLKEYKTIGELKKAFPKLVLHKYIYLDPNDNKLKGANPSDSLPVVENAYITFVGSYEDVIEFTKAASME